MKLTKFIKQAFVPILSAVLLVVALSGNAAAAFNPNRIIDDSVFNNYTVMNASQIDSFLNGFGSSCISPNNTFQAPDVTGYSPSSGFAYGGNVTAGTVISHAAQAYGISPQVLLATLQKEQSLVTGGGGCGTLAYTGAMGYGCPDGGTTYSYSGVDLYTIHGAMVTSVGGTCVNSAAKAGFSQQVIHAAWLLKFGEQRSEGNVGWNVQLTTSTDFSGRGWSSHWDNSDDPQSCYSGPMTQGTFQTCPSGPAVFYDGYRTIDGTSVHMDTGSTASLYWYTPHFSGNQNFQNIFNSWFGSTVTSGFNWQYLGQNAYTDQTMTTPADLNNVWPGQRYYLTVTAQNVGTQTWTQGVVNLATSNPNNRGSAFYDGTWASPARPATLSQGSVAPGQTTTFGFWVTVPNQPGVHREYFNLVADGLSWMNDPGLNWQFNVQQPSYTWQYLGQGAYTDQTMTTPANLNNAVPGQRYYLNLQLKNTGNQAWNPFTLNLGTSNPLNSNSPFSDSTWMSSSRPATVPNTVQPGQTTNIGFWVTVPPGLNKGGVYKQYFDPVADGITWLPDIGLYWQFNVPNAQYSWQYLGQGAYTDQTMTTPANLNSVTAGQRYYLTLQLKNTGNAQWNPYTLNLGTSNPNNRSSAFFDSTWVTASRPTTVPAAIAPGQTTTLGFWVTAPSQPGVHKEYFDPVADGITWLPDIGLYWQVNVQ